MFIIQHYSILFDIFTFVKVFVWHTKWICRHDWIWFGFRILKWMLNFCENFCNQMICSSLQQLGMVWNPGNLVYRFRVIQIICSPDILIQFSGFCEILVQILKRNFKSGLLCSALRWKISMFWCPLQFSQNFRYT